MTALLLLASTLSAQPAGIAVSGEPSVTVAGIDGRTVRLTAADLSRLPQHAVKTKDHGQLAAFDGVLLPDVLAKVATPTGESFHSTGASYYVVVEAADGYRAVLSWAELDPGFTDRKVYLATRRDGKPLPENAGPFQLIVPGEKRGARWVRQVTALRILRAN